MFRMTIYFPIVIVLFKCGQQETSFIKCLIRINQLCHIKIQYLSNTGTCRAHSLWIVEGKGRSWSDMRIANAGKQKTQQGIHITDRSYSRSCISTKTWLINDDRRVEILDSLSIRLMVLWKSSSDPGTVCFIHLSLTRNCIEYDTWFTWTRYTSKYNDSVFWYLNRDILQVVLFQPCNSDRFHSLHPFLIKIC